MNYSLESRDIIHRGEWVALSIHSTQEGGMTGILFTGDGGHWEVGIIHWWGHTAEGRALFTSELFLLEVPSALTSEHQM